MFSNAKIPSHLPRQCQFLLMFAIVECRRLFQECGFLTNLSKAMRTRSGANRTRDSDEKTWRQTCRKALNRQAGRDKGPARDGQFRNMRYRYRDGHELLEGAVKSGCSGDAGSQGDVPQIEGADAHGVNVYANCGRLEWTADAEKDGFDRHLAGCPSRRDEIAGMGRSETMDAALDEEPGPGMERKFNSMLEAYMDGSRTVSAKERTTRGTTMFSGPWHPVFQAAAAVVLVAAGILLGRGMEHGKLKDMEVASLRQELTQMREMVTISMLTQSSAIDRLQGVSMSREVGAPDERLLDALIKTLDADPDVNVRMAAVDALGRYMDRERVKKALVNSLGRQDSPLVQVSLIELLVEMRSPDAKSALKSLIDRKDSLKPVKERARVGLEKMI